MDFDIQRFLAEMRHEMLDGFDRLDKTANQVRADLVEHEMSDLQLYGETKGRLDELTKLRDSLRWAARTVIAAVIVAVVSLVVKVWF